MGTQKTKLLRGDQYGLLKVAELAAEMIAHYERGREGGRTIRIECLDDALWDDIQITHKDHVDRWQVKRLIKDFARKDAAALIASASSKRTTPTHLHLGVATLVNVQKAKGAPAFGFAELAQLCGRARAPGVVAADFHKTEQTNPCYQFVMKALPGLPAASIISTLKTLWIVDLGLEERLATQAERHLQPYFQNARDLVEKIQGWFERYSDWTSPGFVDIPRSVLGARGVTHGKTQATYIHPGVQGRRRSPRDERKQDSDGGEQAVRHPRLLAA